MSIVRNRNRCYNGRNRKLDLCHGCRRSLLGLAATVVLLANHLFAWPWETNLCNFKLEIESFTRLMAWGRSKALLGTD